MVNLEICAADYESVRAAKDGGADRVELCCALSEGGLTPSAGLIAMANNVGIPIHALIRPRRGDFLYSDDEIRLMEQNIRFARQAGAVAIVTGALTIDGDIDAGTMYRLIAAADGMPITFHRAFDLCRNPFENLELLIKMGVRRLLTSGQAPTAEQGIPFLRQLVEKAAGRIEIIAGCGIAARNVERIVRETGVTAVHSSASEVVESPMTFRNENATMGSEGTNDYQRKTTSFVKVKTMREILSSIA